MMCNCDVEPQVRACPCETHDTEAYVAWLTANAPRLAAAREANDPILSFEYLPDASEVPHLSVLREALSGPAREHFDRQWDLATDWWPGGWEFALSIAEGGASMALAWERNALREHLADVTTTQEYPLRDPDEGGDNGLKQSSAEQLMKEADALAELVHRAQALEQMLRDHAAGRATTAADRGSAVPAQPAHDGLS